MKYNRIQPHADENGKINNSNNNNNNNNIIFK